MTLTKRWPFSKESKKTSVCCFPCGILQFSKTRNVSWRRDGKETTLMEILLKKGARRCYHCATHLHSICTALCLVRLFSQYCMRTWMDLVLRKSKLRASFLYNNGGLPSIQITICQREAGPHAPNRIVNNYRITLICFKARANPTDCRHCTTTLGDAVLIHKILFANFKSFVEIGSLAGVRFFLYAKHFQWLTETSIFEV